MRGQRPHPPPLGRRRPTSWIRPFVLPRTGGVAHFTRNGRKTQRGAAGPESPASRGQAQAAHPPARPSVGAESSLGPAQSCWRLEEEPPSLRPRASATAVVTLKLRAATLPMSPFLGSEIWGLSGGLSGCSRGVGGAGVPWTLHPSSLAGQTAASGPCWLLAGDATPSPRVSLGSTRQGSRFPQVGHGGGDRASPRCC